VHRRDAASAEFRLIPFAVVVDARQRVLELDDFAGGVSQLLGFVAGVVTHEFGERRERLGAGAEQTETVAVVVDLHVRHRVAAPSHANRRLPSRGPAAAQRRPLKPRSHRNTTQRQCAPTWRERSLTLYTRYLAIQIQIQIQNGATTA